MSRIIVINKPKGPTSHDIIDAIRKITGEQRIGHAGTLDPLASGVLVVGIGREATRQLGLIVKKEKEYLATIKLGEYSSTDDEEGEKINVVGTALELSDRLDAEGTLSPNPLLGKEEVIETALSAFVGEVYQRPPPFSAIKIKGVPAYKLARRGVGNAYMRSVLAPRKVLIKSIELLEYAWPILKIRVVCGPGVYIRSLARDIGETLGVGGYLKELERTRVGDFKIEEAVMDITL
ncbi:tRNA pseudouridine(55) synthase TruB [Candidatus Falkowbacteria bacterium]|nr:tRNA pseudouridine(55) synthase TruB [Candidatus Falkowbacteria bacterium]